MRSTHMRCLRHLIETTARPFLHIRGTGTAP